MGRYWASRRANTTAQPCQCAGLESDLGISSDDPHALFLEWSDGFDPAAGYDLELWSGDAGDESLLSTTVVPAIDRSYSASDVPRPYAYARLRRRCSAACKSVWTTSAEILVMSLWWLLVALSGVGCSGPSSARLRVSWQQGPAFTLDFGVVQGGVSNRVAAPK